MPKIGEFAQQYIDTALWSCLDDSDVPLDKNYKSDDIEPDSLQRMIEDCETFQEQYGDLIDSHGTRSRAGHDFWLTRNGHGTGFWDGDWPDCEDELTEGSTAFGECRLCPGEDGKLYLI